MKKTDLAWSAGFLDGEGYFQATKTVWKKRKKSPGFRVKAYPYFKIITCQNDVRVLRKLKRIIGGAISGPYHYPPSEPYFSFCLCTNAADVFMRLYPYLSPVKRKQGREALANVRKRLRTLRIWLKRHLHA